jgi:hypothetical protein
MEAASKKRSKRGYGHLGRTNFRDARLRQRGRWEGSKDMAKRLRTADQ